MYTKYEVDGADSFTENFWKPRKCTDGRTQGTNILKQDFSAKQLIFFNRVNTVTMVIHFVVGTSDKN